MSHWKQSRYWIKFNLTHLCIFTHSLRGWNCCVCIMDAQERYSHKWPYFNGCKKRMQNKNKTTLAANPAFNRSKWNTEQRLGEVCDSSQTPSGIRAAPKERERTEPANRGGAVARERRSSLRSSSRGQGEWGRRLAGCSRPFW